jgi:hypothetical protein
MLLPGLAGHPARARNCASPYRITYLCCARDVTPGYPIRQPDARRHGHDQFHAKRFADRFYPADRHENLYPIAQCHPHAHRHRHRLPLASSITNSDSDARPSHGDEHNRSQRHPASFRNRRIVAPCGFTVRAMGLPAATIKLHA